MPESKEHRAAVKYRQMKKATFKEDFLKLV